VELFDKDKDKLRASTNKVVSLLAEEVLVSQQALFTVQLVQGRNCRSESSSQIREFGRHFLSHRSNLDKKKAKCL
jgi:hypothetical protein